MRFLLCLALLGIPASHAVAAEPSAKFTAFDLDRSRGMLGMARDEVAKQFYDPERVGPDFIAECKRVHEALASAKSNDAALMMIAQPFLNIGDSHTRFIPPGRMAEVDHRWKFHAIGPDVYVSEVEKGSDAEKQGLRVGDKLLNLDGLAPTRQNAALMRYMLYGLAPRTGMSVIVQAPGQQPRQLDIKGAIRAGTRLREFRNDRDYAELEEKSVNENLKLRSRFAELPGNILVWKLREFDFEKIAPGLTKAAAAKVVVLDLRGNPGGLVRATEDMLNAFFSDDFEAFTMKSRKKSEVTRVKGKGTFTGTLLVLIDHSSASASEVFARTVQMRQRGVLIGDRTAGALTTAMYYPQALGTPQKFTAFGVYVAISSFVMADGTVVEGKGVTPDYQVLPTHAQLYAGHDLVLAQALALVGHKITPEAAGKLIPPLE